MIVLITQHCSAEIINVPDDFETIQSAINDTQAGDTVLVQPGTYVENITFRNTITVASLFLLTEDEAFIDSTFIDGNEDGTVITFYSGQTSRLVGFTIQNGFNRMGGGIYWD